MIWLLSMMIVATTIGTFARWGVAQNLWGLLAVNVAGSLLAGWVAGTGRLDQMWSTVILVGLCGSLTTFSGFSVFMMRLLEQGEFFKFILHFFLNNAMCLSMCYIGFLFASKS